MAHADDRYYVPHDSHWPVVGSAGLLFLMVGAPTAMVAFVMAREFAPGSGMTAEVIALTTILMPVTVTAGWTVLSSLGFI